MNTPEYGSPEDLESKREKTDAEKSLTLIKAAFVFALILTLASMFSMFGVWLTAALLDSGILGQTGMVLFLMTIVFGAGTIAFAGGVEEAQKKVKEEKFTYESKVIDDLREQKRELFSRNRELDGQVRTLKAENLALRDKIGDSDVY